MSDIGADPSLRPLADVGTTGVTVKGKRQSASRPASRGPSEPAEADSGPENAPGPVLREDDVDALHAAGFRKRHGAWVRAWHGQ